MVRFVCVFFLVFAVYYRKKDGVFMKRILGIGVVILICLALGLSISEELEGIGSLVVK